MSGAPRETAPVLAHALPRVVPQPRPQARPQPVPQAPVAATRHVVREPTFDELVTGVGRHRGRQDLQGPASLLRRLAMRARVLPTPARRTAARPAGAP
jgi:hypothetical protein